jgi:hypothetical protein
MIFGTGVYGIQQPSTAFPTFPMQPHTSSQLLPRTVIWLQFIADGGYSPPG